MLKIKTILCESLVLSHLNYCDVVYGPCLTKHDCQRLQRVQNSCTRLICGLRRRQAVSHKIAELNWLPIYKRRCPIHSSILFTKIIENKLPSYLYDKISFRTDVHNINIRRKDVLTIPLHRTSSYQKSFSYIVCKVINLLPLDIKSLKPITLKKHLKHKLLNNQLEINFNV